MSADLPFTYNIVNGIVFPSAFVTQQRIDELQAFPFQQGDLIIVTYPKSGSTWMQQIVRLIRSEGQDDGLNVVRSVPWLEALDPHSPYHSDYSVPDIDKIPSPRAFKSHLPYEMLPGGSPTQAMNVKYIYVVRNPKDVAVSVYYQLRSFSYMDFSGSWDDVFQLFLEGRVYYGSWFDHVLGWWKHRDEKKMLFLKYEDMKEDLPKAVKTIADFMGYSLKPDVFDSIIEQCTFASMKANPATNYSWADGRHNLSEPPFMRKGVVGDWKNHFTPEQSAKFDSVYTKRMEGTGLHLDFAESDIAGQFGTKGLAITFVSNEDDARVLNSVQDRFEINITELPSEIDANLYIEGY